MALDFVADGVFRGIWDPNTAITWAESLVDGSEGLLIKYYGEDDEDAKPVTQWRLEHVVEVITGNAQHASYITVCLPGGNVTFRYLALCIVSGKLHLRHISTHKQHQRAGAILSPMRDLVMFKSSTADLVCTLFGRVENRALTLELVAPSGAPMFTTTFSLNFKVSVGMMRSVATSALIGYGVIGPLMTLKLLNGNVVLKDKHIIWAPRCTSPIRVRLWSKQTRAQAKITEFFKRR
jgi:hypothetical protein